MLKNPFKQSARAKQDKSLFSREEWLLRFAAGGGIASIIFMSSVFSYHVTKPKARTPEQVLQEMGYNPDLITNMPDGAHIKVYTQRHALNRLIQPDNLQCNGTYKFTNIWGGASIYTPEEQCAPIISWAKVDFSGKFYAITHPLDLDPLFTLLHEWAHDKNIPLYENTILAEIDSDLSALSAMADLGINTSRYRSLMAQERAVNAFFSYYLDDDDDNIHDSSLAIILIQDGQSPSIEELAQRTNAAKEVLKAYIPEDLTERKMSIREFAQVMRAIDHLKPWEKNTQILSPQTISDTNIYAENLLNGLNSLLDNELTQDNFLEYDNRIKYEDTSPN